MVQFRSMTVLVSALALVAPAVAREVRYVANENQSVWTATSSRLHCTLTHEIPYYGKAVFEKKAGGKLVIRVGYSHPVEVSPLPGVTLSVEGANRIKVSGINKEVVGEMAAEIRAIRPPDAYKGKGIRYAGEIVRLKAGKAGKAIGKRK